MKTRHIAGLAAAILAAPIAASAQTPAVRLEMDFIHAAPLTFAAMMLTLGILVLLDRRASSVSPGIGPMVRFAVRFIARHWKAAPGPLVLALVGAVWTRAAQAEDPEGGQLIAIVTAALSMFFEASGYRLAFLGRGRQFKLGRLGFNLGFVEGRFYGSRLIFALFMLIAILAVDLVIAAVNVGMDRGAPGFKTVVLFLNIGVGVGLLLALAGRMLLFTPVAIAGSEVDPAGAWRVGRGLLLATLVAVLAPFLVWMLALLVVGVLTAWFGGLGWEVAHALVYAVGLMAVASFITGGLAYLTDAVMPVPAVVSTPLVLSG
jgi:hypothetical protein